MTQITLTEEQVRALNGASEHVSVYDTQGRLLGTTVAYHERRSFGGDDVRRLRGSSP